MNRLLLALLCGAQFMVILDVSVIWIALPAMREELGLSTAGMQWVVNAYTVVIGGFLLLAGRAGDVFGRKRVFMTGLVLFTAASLACGAASSETWLVAARAMQGLGGAILLPATLALVTTLFREGAERDRAVALWGAVGGLAGSVGFLVGGVLIEAFGWPAIFFINVPVGTAIAVLALRAVPDDPPARAPRGRELDAVGAVLVTAGLVALVFGIVRTEQIGWGSAETLVAMALSLLVLAAFVRHEGRHPHPLMPLHVFHSRELTSANGAMVMLGAVRFGMWFLMALYMQDVLGYSPLQAGLAFLPLLLLMSAGSSRASEVARRFGFRATVVVSFLVTAVGLWLLTSAGVAGSFLADILVPSIILGLGLGISVVPLTLAGVGGAADADAGLAAGLSNVSRQVGGALGIALLGTLAATRASDVLASPGAQDRVAALAAGYRHAFWFAAAFAVCGALIALLLPSGRGREDVPPGLAIENAST